MLGCRDHLLERSQGLYSDTQSAFDERVYFFENFRLTFNDHSSTTTVVMMKSNQHHRLGDLQLRILQALWERDECGVAEVHAALQTDRKLAHTTISTMLRKMEVRGLVAHREEGRAFLYRAAVEADEVTRSVGRHFVERLFEGNMANAVSHLLQTREVSRDELDQIEKFIKQAKRRAK
jgi:predicted transcriptional regulator